jgi:hypothetical protein
MKLVDPVADLPAKALPDEEREVRLVVDDEDLRSRHRPFFQSRSMRLRTLDGDRNRKLASKALSR